MRHFASIFFVFLSCIAGTPSLAQVINRGKPMRTGVMIPLHEDINPLSGELLKQKFQQAIDSGADVIVLDINSPGRIHLCDVRIDGHGAGCHAG